MSHHETEKLPPRRTHFDRILTVAALLSLPILAVGMGRSLQTVMTWGKEEFVANSRRNLVDSLLGGFSDRSVLGNTHGTNGLIEFIDYQCPACRAGAALVDSAVDGPLHGRVIILHLPLNIHGAARRAALAAICAEVEGQFPAMHSLLLTSELDSSVAGLWTVARKAGIGDSATFVGCLQGERAAIRIERDLSLAERLGVQGTPTFFVARNGRALGLRDLPGRLRGR